LGYFRLEKGAAPGSVQEGHTQIKKVSTASLTKKARAAHAGSANGKHQSGGGRGSAATDQGFDLNLDAEDADSDYEPYQGTASS
jgi:hypothetical protein